MDCNTESQPASSNEPTPYKKSYDGNKAASWAVGHARDPQKYGVNDEDCTWFVSQALVAGGIAQNDIFHLWGHYGFPHIPGTNIGSGAPGTATTWIAPKLISYILKTYPDSTWKELSFDQNNQPDIKPGDIIAYDWYPGQGNGIDHLSIVVDDSPGTQYPEVAEWGNVAETGMSAPYSKRGWSWSQTSNPPQWIAKATGGQAKAYVLHIDTGLDGVQIASGG